MMTRIRQMSQEKGFTLIELLIVIVILGILAAVGIPKFMSNKRDAWSKTCKANRATLDDACERYHFDLNAWPTGQSDLLTPSAGQPYIKNTFNCPATDSDTYVFSNASTAVTCSNTGTAADQHD